MNNCIVLRRPIQPGLLCPITTNAVKLQSAEHRKIRTSQWRGRTRRIETCSFWFEQTTSSSRPHLKKRYFLYSCYLFLYLVNFSAPLKLPPGFNNSKLSGTRSIKTWRNLSTSICFQATAIRRESLCCGSQNHPCQWERTRPTCNCKLTDFFAALICLKFLGVSRSWVHWTCSESKLFSWQKLQCHFEVPHTHTHTHTCAHTRYIPCISIWANYLVSVN